MEELFPGREFTIMMSVMQVAPSVKKRFPDRRRKQRQEERKTVSPHRAVYK